jgi:hypothetical protein
MIDHAPVSDAGRAQGALMDKVQPEKCPEKPRGALDAHAARPRELP